MSYGHLGAAIWHRWTIICAVPSKCYTDKPETIDALNDNIREAIGEIQLHTIDNILPRSAEAATGMKLLSIINRKDCTFK